MMNTCTKCGGELGYSSPFPQLCTRCDEEAHTCPDCGSWVYDGEHCEYCYEIVTRYTVKVGNRVLYRGYDQEEADRIFSQANDGHTRVRWHTQEGILMNRRVPVEV